MHDDRITRVTFEENTSRNALIVNEEYAWIGNPFSAPEEGRSRKVLPSFRMPAHGGLGTCDLKTPLPWAGGDVSKKWRGALVFRLRILLSGRADGQSIESSSSALPPLISFSLSCPFPCPVFRFRPLVVRGAGPGSDPASILQRTAFCLGGFGVSAVLGPGITPRPKIRERRCPFRRRNRSICRFRRSRC